MSSSLEGNKLIAAVLTAGILAVGAGVVSGIIYAPHMPEEMAYAVALPDSEGTADSADEAPVSLGVLLASADAAAGEGVAKKCLSCHSFEEGGENKVGPALWGVVGRPIGSAAGFGYSDALAGHGGNWDYEALSGFLADPKGWAPGTTMSFAGVRKDDERADLILYMRSLSPDAPPLPELEEAAVDEAAADEAAAEEAPAEEAAAGEDATGETEVAAATEAVDTPAEDATATDDTTAADEGAAEEAATEETTAADAEEPAADTQAADAQGTDSQEGGDAASEADAAASEEAEAVAEDATTEEATAEAADAGDAAESAEGAATAVALAGDPEAGAKVARKCRACHVFDEAGKHRVGPSLYGVVDNDIAAAEGFKYSDALTGIEGAWTVENLDAYLADPRGWAPGNRMAFGGIKDEQERQDLIAYLATFTDE